MRNLALRVLLALSAQVFLSCSDKSSNPTKLPVQGSLRQLPGCQQLYLTKVTSNDSCFMYQFSDKLMVDFCLSANCCPDSNRFSLRYEIRNDTIFVVAADTAAHLCYCNCSYLIRAEFDNLPLNHYVFYCTREDYSDRKVFYNQHVYRSSMID